MSAEKWALRLAWFLDALALVSLAGTGEVSLSFYLGIALALLASRIPKFRIPEKILFGFLILLVLSAGFVWFRFRYAPVLIVAYLAPMVHATLWFAPNTTRYRSWRLGVGFMELIIASTLTVDLYLPAAIFMFVVVSAVKMSCEFLDEKLRSLDLELARRPLPPLFIRSSLGAAFLIFLTSAIIFPILPRLKNESLFGSGDSTRIGYTEDVNLNEGVAMTGSGGSAVDLWLYPKGDYDLAEVVPKNLIRMKVHSGFNGTSWSSDRRSHRVSPLPPLGKNSSAPIQVEAIREPIGSYVLPLPYGAENVRPSRGDLSARFQRQDTGEWIDAFASNERLLYTFDLYPYGSPVEAKRLNDEPTPNQLSLPLSLGPQNERIERLAHKIFGNAKTEGDKVDRLRYFFEHSGFRGSESGLVNQEFLRNPLAAKMAPLERFLFLSKEGHCEWFASASAVLLRLAGVPTRLATGFRVSQPSTKGAIRVRASDAHAWVEVWIPERGWQPYDPTPRLLQVSSLASLLRGGYDDLSGYWYRYILSFNSETGEIKHSNSSRTAVSMASASIGQDVRWLTDYLGFASIAFLGFGILTAAMFAFYYLRRAKFFSFSKRVSAKEGRPEMRRERLSLERLLRSRLGEPEISRASEILRLRKWLGSEDVLARWRTLYERARFGREPSSIRPLKRLRRALKLSLKKELRAHTP